VKVGVRIHKILMFLMIFQVTLVILSDILSNNAFALLHTLHDRTLYEVVDQTSSSSKNPEIGVGDSPIAIAVAEASDAKTAYVANNPDDISHSGSVSVISIENNSKIGDVTVGDAPRDIAVSSSGIVYVANFGSDTVSVITTNPWNNTMKVENVTVGDGPIAIDSNVPSDRAYVANTDSDTVSVITTNPWNNTMKVENVTVGDAPRDIAVDIYSDTVYVAKPYSDSVSIIDGTANKVVAGVTFQVYPFNSGYIVCDNLSTSSPDDLTPPSPVGQYIYVYSGTQCIARPNAGFEFSSWEENLEDNATQPISIWRPSYVDSFFEFFNPNSDRPEATLNITKFGTFTANFRELSPPIPPEFWLQLLGFVAAAVIGWSIPSIVGGVKSRRETGKLNYYHKQITSLYDNDKLDENDIEALDQISGNIADAYSRGKINKERYETLKDETSVIYEKIFRKNLGDFLNSNNNPDRRKSTEEQLAQIRNDVKTAYSEGKMNEKHYDLLNKDILELNSKDRDNTT
jgi:YVTN family beta-propeller protein